RHRPLPRRAPGRGRAPRQGRAARPHGDRYGLGRRSSRREDRQRSPRHVVAADRKADVLMHYDPFDATIPANPHPIYALLRVAHPVYRSSPTDTFVLSRYDDVATALRDTDRFSSDAMNGVLLGYPTGDGKERLPRSAARGGLVSVDPPAHTELRRIVNR